MRTIQPFVLCAALLVAAARLLPVVAAAQADDPPDDPLVQLVIDLLGEKDRELRSLGLEQVRTQLKGEAATRTFAAQLPKLPPDAQAALLAALADRNDRAARPAVLELLAATPDAAVRLAAIESLGALGAADDVPRLAELLTDQAAPVEAAARNSLVRVQGDGVTSALIAQLRRGQPATKAALLPILAVRRATDAAEAMLPVARHEDAAVRAAAMAALAELAGPELMPGLVQGVLAAEPGAERSAAERAVMLVCARIEDPAQRAAPLLAAMQALGEADRRVLLPALGRVGGSDALEQIEAAIAGADSQLRDAGIRALCNWPDASVAPRMRALAEAQGYAEYRATLLRALIRVAPLPDGRPDDQRLALVRQVMVMCSTDEDRKLLVQRTSAIRTPEALRFVLPYMDDSRYAEAACLAVVELAHHRGLREPNKELFHAALDRVIATSKDAVVVDRAQRYQRGETFVRPKPEGKQ